LVIQDSKGQSELLREDNGNGGKRGMAPANGLVFFSPKTER
jgi:hypothetical protein